MPDAGNPNWWKSAVIYQIYPKSFADTTGSGQGDLAGITAHLNYLRDLGADLLWLSPIYVSPQQDNGYDVSDFCAIDPRFGTFADFEELVAEADKRGMGIVLDMILNHTSSEHPWFRDAAANPDSPWHDFYIWSPTGDGSTSVFGEPAWTWAPQAGMFYYGSFSHWQPDLNWDNPAVRQAMFDIMQFWRGHGAAGFRLDAVPYISKDLCRGQRCQGPRLHNYLQEMRRTLGPEVLLLGEDTEAELDDALLYTDPARAELNAVFEFGLEDYDRCGDDKWQRAPLDLVGLKRHYADWQAGLAGRGRMALFLTNHDRPRIVSRWGSEGEFWRESATAFATAVYLLEGSVVIYQGEELGMTNLALPIESYDDIETHNYYRRQLAAGAAEEQVMAAIHARSRDNARTPMQWDEGVQAGFTTGSPWLPVNPNHVRINARSEQCDERSVLHYYRRLLALRRLPVLQAGDFALVAGDDPNVFAYTRTLGGEQIRVECNWSAEPQRGPFPAGTLLLSNYDDPPQDFLRPYEARVTRCEPA